MRHDVGCVFAIGINDFATSKVANLNFAPCIDKYVLRLQISMGNFSGVHLSNSNQKLIHITLNRIVGYSDSALAKICGLFLLLLDDILEVIFEVLKHDILD